MENLKIYAIASDPIYIGTGGYTIGRVDNTIVRDPTTQIPKIPGSSFAGTMRFYMALVLQSAFKDDYKKDLKNRKDKKMEELLNEGQNIQNWMKYEGNRYALMKCAGQDDNPNEYYENYQEIEKIDEVNSGHCGHCIVCQTFGYSKNKRSRSQQGIAFFSDLNILFFPVYTRFGVKWITSPQVLEFAGIEFKDVDSGNGEEVIMVVENVQKNDTETKTINLGWINLPYKTNKIETLPLKGLDQYIEKHITNNSVIVPDSLISHIINSNLEVRTSVSINPLTGAARESALFTSEAIPRGTVFYGEIRLIDRPLAKDMINLCDIKEALELSSKYYESFGIGGMTTRGFGRIKMFISSDDNKQ
ncbi:MAG: hypothetical protein HPY74_07020 [Firmicutes bacterium]|nr:hypothetical protein [Bacillota bacterium]